METSGTTIILTKIQILLIFRRRFSAVWYYHPTGLSISLVPDGNIWHHIIMTY